MRKNIKTVALLAVLSVAAAGCEKDTTIVDTGVVAGEDVSMKMVTYTVDGVTTRVAILSDEAWHDFLDWMFALAEEGHRVSFRRGNPPERSVTKEADVITFTTKDQQEAQAWATQMSLAGYEVSIDFDKATGIYTCIAVK